MNLLSDLDRARLLLAQAHETDARLRRRLHTIQQSLGSMHRSQRTQVAFATSRRDFLSKLCERSERRLDRRALLVERLTA